MKWGTWPTPQTTFQCWIVSNPFKFLFKQVHSLSTCLLHFLPSFPKHSVRPASLLQPYFSSSRNLSSPQFNNAPSTSAAAIDPSQYPTSRLESHVKPAWKFVRSFLLSSSPPLPKSWAKCSWSTSHNLNGFVDWTIMLDCQRPYCWFIVALGFYHVVPLGDDDSFLSHVRNLILHPLCLALRCWSSANHAAKTLDAGSNLTASFRTLTKDRSILFLVLANSLLNLIDSNGF